MNNIMTKTNNITAVIYKILAAVMLFVLLCAVSVHAEGTPIIKDEANLLTYSEEEMLYNTMLPLTEYGGVAFVTNGEEDSYSGEASDLAKSLCREYFNGESGTVLLIDMYNRRIEIYSTGLLYRYISKANANMITDNTYTYATAGDYYTCASKCFEQMLTVASGGHISTPLRYVSNAFMAIFLALFINFSIAYVSRCKIHFGKKVLHHDVPYGFEMDNGTVNIIEKKLTKKRKTVHSEGSSGGGGGGGGGSSGGGGGGGGGHSF